jgi:DNA-directed RNA polymerase sigma subunit (sigma70/sigma32)
MRQTCCLDVAEEPRTLEEIGEIVGLTRERVRQMCEQALKRAALYARRHGIEWTDPIDWPRWALSSSRVTTSER